MRQPLPAPLITLLLLLPILASRPGSREPRCSYRMCYVNSNFMIALERKVEKAIEFAEANRGCLFTSRPHIEAEFLVHEDAEEALREIREKLDVQLRVPSRPLRGKNRGALSTFR